VEVAADAGARVELPWPFAVTGTLRVRGAADVGVTVRPVGRDDFEASSWSEAAEVRSALPPGRYRVESSARRGAREVAVEAGAAAEVELR